LETIYILAKVDASHAESIIVTIGKIEGVKFVHAVTGPYDVLICMEGPSVAKLLSRSIKEISGLDGIRSTETLVAIKFD
jgi:DNA-binding Lrp family transcriptional regulator